jgi:hypothetical protein
MAAVVNQWTIADVNNYGIAAVPVAPTPGNALMAFVAWNSSQTIQNPVSNVADDSNSWWNPLGITSAAGNVRMAAWMAPNIRPGYGSGGGASVVSLAFSWLVLGMCGLIVEFSGFPQFWNQDFAPVLFTSNTGSSGNTFNATATVPDFCFTCMASGNNSNTVNSPGAPWNLLTGIQVNDPAGIGGPADTKLQSSWQAAAAGAVSAAWTWTANTPVAGMMIGLKQSPAAPASSNFYWPKIKVEAAFGYQPGDPTTVPTWTDISAFAYGPAGQAWIKAQRGREYEINQAEAGYVQVGLNNQTGAFIPGNTSGPFYPNILLQTLIRASAFWDNVQLGIGSGFVERFPQEYPVTPQWGFVPVVGSDAISVLSNAVLLSAVAGDVLADGPYAYFRCGDSYTNANGASLANASRTNQRSAAGVGGESRTGTGGFPVGTGNTLFPLQTGLPLGLAGDTGTGIGQSGSAVSIFTGPGMLYSDPNLPQPGALPAAVSYEFWAVLPTNLGSNDQTLFQVLGAPANFYNNTERLLFHGIAGTLNIVVSDTGGNTSGFTYTINVADGLPHHYMIQVWTSGGNYKVNLYIDGVLQGGTKTSAVTITIADWTKLILGPAVTSQSGAANPQSWNWTAGHLAVYGYQVPIARIQSHVLTGTTGYSGDTNVQRFARLMTWSGYGLARASDTGSPSPLNGPADSIDGQYVSPALFTIAQAGGDANYCDAAGNVVYRSRTAQYNHLPKWVFGDNPPSPLNQNSTFGSRAPSVAAASPGSGSLAGWNAVGGTSTITLSQAQTFKGPWSCLLTPDGVTAVVFNRSTSFVRVFSANSYLATSWVFSANGTANGQVGIDWYTAAQVFISSSLVTVAVPASQWTKISSGPLTPPGTAVFGLVRVGESGTPAGAATLFMQQTRLTANSVEIPYKPEQSFGFDNSFLYDVVQASRQVSASLRGVVVNLSDTASVKQYMQRFLPSVSIETTSDQDAYDWGNWNLARYKQPALRTISIVLDPVSFPDIWGAVLGMEQTDVCQVIRRPLGAPAFAQLGQIQKISHEGGTGVWRTTVAITPYSISSNVLVSGTAGYDVVGNNALAW